MYNYSQTAFHMRLLYSKRTNFIITTVYFLKSMVYKIPPFLKCLKSFHLILWSSQASVLGNIKVIFGQIWILGKTKRHQKGFKVYGLKEFFTTKILF